MMRGYLADPTKIRIMHVGAREVPHLPPARRRRPLALQPRSPTRRTTTPTRGCARTRRPCGRPRSASTPSPSAPASPTTSRSRAAPAASSSLPATSSTTATSPSTTFGHVGLLAGLRHPSARPRADAGPAAPADRGGLARPDRQDHQRHQITATNLDSWIRPQLPPSGVPRDGHDADRLNWKVAGTACSRSTWEPRPTPRSTPTPHGLPRPAEPPGDRPQAHGGQRPTILFNPGNGRPAYPFFRTNIGKRPPFTPDGHTGHPGSGATPGRSTATQSVGQPHGRPVPRGARYAPSTSSPSRSRSSVRRLSRPRRPALRPGPGQGRPCGDPRRSDPLAIRANQGL